MFTYRSRIVMMKLVACDRKNKERGSRLVRGCWCRESMATCPLHVLGPVLDTCETGHEIFPGITPASALSVLRDVLDKLGVDDAWAYRTHDFRRGHAQDLIESGSPLSVILAAGEWKSPAFLAYINEHFLERDVVVNAHMDESDGE